MKILRAIAWLAIGPAVYVNIEAMPMPWTPFAIGSVILAAAFVYLAWEKRSWRDLYNLATALGNVASMSAETVDGRSSVIQRRDGVNGNRNALNEARKVQVRFAGEVSAEVLTLLSCGKTQKKVAAVLGIGERTVKRIVALSKKGHLAPMWRYRKGAKWPLMAHSDHGAKRAATIASAKPATMPTASANRNGEHQVTATVPSASALVRAGHGFDPLIALSSAATSSARSPITSLSTRAPWTYPAERNTPRMRAARPSAWRKLSLASVISAMVSMQSLSAKLRPHRKLWISSVLCGQSLIKTRNIARMRNLGLTINLRQVLR